MPLRGRIAITCALAGAALAVAAAQALAYNYVTTQSGLSWGVQDGAAPRVDTGSIRDATANSLRGFGGIRVRVSTDPLRNEELVRGFNLRFDSPNRFESESSVDLGGVAIWRSIHFHRGDDWGRWLDSFRNTTDEPIEVDVLFGGQTGLGSSSGANNAAVSDTSSGDDVVTPEDSWAVTRTGSAPDPVSNGPSAVVVGTPAPFEGAMTRLGSFLYQPFDQPPVPSGHESNFVGYQNSFTLAPGETRSLAHFVVIGDEESEETAGEEVAEVTDAAADLASDPAFGHLTKAEICSLDNWDVEALSIAAFDAATDCPAVGDPPMPPVAAVTPVTTSSPYDVVGKTIADLRADMEAGLTTSQEITRAYLDRIAAYDVGPWGFNAFEIVADDAMAQAAEADLARAEGDSGPLLGIPLAIKNLYDTFDMPTTNGSLVFDGFQPLQDATQVRLLREAGAVILGKASMEEYAQSGNYSDSAYGQVWNAFDPSKSSIASSGGTSVAIAASLAAAGLGSQTGDSLYGPASAASQWTLRGTDGIASSYGVWPLVWWQDFPGTIARSASDLADMLNVTTGTDPLDPVTVAADADANRPDDWRDYLDPDALEGARIGYYESAFVDPRGTTGTVDAQMAALEHFEDAGATLVEISEGPSFSVNYSGDRQFTGWQLWIDDHPNSPYQDPREILGSQLRLPYRRSTNGYNGSGMMSEAEIDTLLAARAQRKEDVADWLDNPPDPIDPETEDPSPGALDAVVFPGLKSVISLNDGGSSAFGRGDPPTNSAGAPSVAFPATVNDHGEPTNLQLVGRAWQDPELIGFAYAFDQVANGQIEAQTAPALDYAPLPPEATGRIAFAGPRKVAVRRNRVARVRVRCVGAPSCAATLRLRSGGKQIARTALPVDAGPPTTARLRLRKRAMKRLRRTGELRATLLAVVAGESGERASSKQLRLTLR